MRTTESAFKAVGQFSGASGTTSPQVIPLPQERQARFVLESLQRWLALAGLECKGVTVPGCRATFRTRPVPEALAEAVTHPLRGRHHDAGQPVTILRVSGDEPPPTARLDGTPYYPLNMVHAAEPRIETLARSVSALLSMVCLATSDAEVHPDGFHLRHLLAWRTQIRPHDTEPIEHYLATGLCNVNCDFCYEHGTPPEMRTPKFRVHRAELDTRLRYYDAQRGLALFDMFHQYYDAFAHPDALDVLKQVRQRSAGVLDLITNGRRLTGNVVDSLDGLRPLQLTISLNSQDPAVRERVMRDRTPEIAAQSLPLLHEAKIPFGIVVVPWPPEIDTAELKRTVRFVDPFKPLFVSISLPGYTRWFPNPPQQLDDAYHRRILATVRHLRSEVATPLLVQPRMAEAVFYGEDHTRPFVLGTTPGAPAGAAGLRYGDTLASVNGFETPFASQASKMVRLSEELGAHRLELVVERAGERLDVMLKRRGDSDMGWGLVLGDGLDPLLFRQLGEQVMRAAERDVWLLSSRWMQSAVRSMVDRTAPGAEVASRMTVVPVENRYFGGNICLGDLLTVDDFAQALDDRLACLPRPDRVVVPGSAFTRWGRDLSGRSVQRLRRRFDVPITVVNNRRIMV